MWKYIQFPLPCSHWNWMSQLSQLQHPPGGLWYPMKGRQIQCLGWTWGGNGILPGRFWLTTPGMLILNSKQDKYDVSDWVKISSDGFYLHFPPHIVDCSNRHFRRYFLNLFHDIDLLSDFSDYFADHSTFWTHFEGLFKWRKWVLMGFNTDCDDRLERKGKLFNGKTFYHRHI